jgi:pyridoxal phosphate enzyme (YggS family)
MNWKEVLADRLTALEKRIREACQRSNRRREEVTIVAVTKSVSSQVAEAITTLGVKDLGESRPQELWRKRDTIHEAVRWHLVGRLQTNKIERTLPVHLVHSVDSFRLLEKIEESARRSQLTAKVLLQANVTGEPCKQGLTPAECIQTVQRLHLFGYARVKGLMTIAQLDAAQDAVAETFRTLRDLRDRMRLEIQPPHEIEELSMGMSNDFESAVEQGATIVRIGSLLFSGLAGDSVTP